MTILLNNSQCFESFPQAYERLFKFSRLVCSMDFDYMMEGFQYESELKHKVIKMQVRRYQ